jgi:hypothetical protein
MYIERNFRITKGLPFFPFRRWRNNTPPGDVPDTKAATVRRSGARTISTSRAMLMSKIRFCSELR